MSEPKKAKLKVIERNEIDSTVSFLTQNLKHNVNRDIYEWEFLTFEKDTVSMGAFYENKTVGCQFMMPIYMNFGTKKFLTGKSENSYVDKSFRGSGIFKDLYFLGFDESKNKGMKTIWGFTPAIKVFRDKLGFNTYEEGMITATIRVKKPKLANSSLLKVVHGQVKETLNNQKVNQKTGKDYQTFMKDITILNEPKNWNDLDSVFNTVKKSYPDLVHISMSKEYFHWRISNNPHINYKTNFFYRGDKLVGYYVFSTHNHELNIGTLIGDSNETTRHLLAHLLSISKDLSGTETINYMGNKFNALNNFILDEFKSYNGKHVPSPGMAIVIKYLDENFEHNNVPLENILIDGLWTEGTYF